MSWDTNSRYKSVGKAHRRVTTRLADARRTRCDAHTSRVARETIASMAMMSTDGGGGDVSDAGVSDARGAHEVQGVRVFTDALSSDAHDGIVRWIAEELARGRRGELHGRTFAPVPPKWAKRDQSREMLQYGTYTHSNRVEDDFEVSALPKELIDVVDALIACGVIQECERFDSCTINVYGKGQWIPPHIDNPAFARPFVTVSLLSAQDMVLGRGIIWPADDKPEREAVYEGEELRLSLPARSAVRVEGDAADVYEHAIPPVSEDRISLTFRRRLDLQQETDLIAAQVAMTESFRSLYREKRRSGRVETPTLPKEESDETKRRLAIAAERARIKAAREERKKAKALRKEGYVAAAEELEKSATALAETDVASASSSSAKAAEEAEVQLVKKPPKRACAVVPENLIDAAAKVTAMPEVEREHVQKVYDIVAQQWHGTRYRAWTGVEAFIRKQPAGLLAADVGCGNGKNIPEVVKGGGFALGSDFSRGLIEICRDNSYEVMVADAVILPYRSNVFDYALNIAVLHHISSPERRVELVKETMRIIKVGGVALFYAWALEQEQGGVSGHQFEGQDVLVPFHNKIKVKGVAPETQRERESRVAGAPAHGEADPEKRSVVYQRYCHVYVRGELSTLFTHLPWCDVEREYYDHGNWCVEVRKTTHHPQP